DEAVSLIQARTGLSQEGLPDLRETNHRLSAGASLTQRDFLDVRVCMKQSRAAKQSLGLLGAETFPRLTKFLPSLFVLYDLVNAIEEAIDDAGQMRDHASPKLYSLRKEVQHLDRDIKDSLNKIIRSSTLSKALQEPLYTQRG